MTATVIYVGGPDAETASSLLHGAGVSGVVVLGRDQVEELRRADAAGTRYRVVHVGEDDGVAGGSFERAHHRVSLAKLPELAERLRPRGRPLVTCLAFGYKNGLPEEATWVVDVRFLDNPYWVPSLRELTGRDAEVAEYVLGQPAAAELMERLEAVLRWALPLYQSDRLTIAFGCTGGRHRSVALAAEMSRRLAGMDGVDVEFLTRDL